MANDSAISLQTIDVLLYCTWRDANGLCEDFSCYAWVVFDELENSINGILFFFLTTFLTTFYKFAGTYRDYNLNSTMD